MFKCIAELDLGPQAASSYTVDTMHTMLREVLAAGEFSVVLNKEIVAGNENLAVWERVDTKHNLRPSELMKLGRLAQKGNRLAVFLLDIGKMLLIIESSGYVRCAQTSLGAEAFVDGWAAFLDQHFPDVKGALVFGHDWEPLYIFENLE